MVCDVAKANVQISGSFFHKIKKKLGEKNDQADHRGPSANCGLC